MIPQLGTLKQVQTFPQLSSLELEEQKEAWVSAIEAESGKTSQFPPS